MQALKWVLPSTPWSTTAAHHCSTDQPSPDSLQSFLAWTCFAGLLQIPTWANHSSSFPKVSVSSSSFRLWQCSAYTQQLQKAAHGDSPFQHPCLQCFVFHLVQLQQQHHPAVRVDRFFTVSLIPQHASSNWSCSNETSTFSGRLPMYTKLRLQSAVEPTDWMRACLHI